MSPKPLALALAGLTAIAPCSRADEGSARARLERRAAERGPIRQRVEAALTVPATVIAAEAVEAARGQASRRSATSTGPRIHPAVWVLIGLACVLAALYQYGRAWSQI